MPLPIHHPSDDEGRPISCNSPEVIESQTVGRLWNVEYNESPSPRLRGEIYVDVVKAQAISPPTLDALTRNQPLEVSTGLFSNDEQVQGTWNNETYQAIVRDIRPDHLALLPGSRGACSWQDGCGVRANKEGGDMDKVTVTVNELSLDDRRTAVVRAVYAMDGPTQDNMIVACFEDSVVYETRPGPQSAAGTPVHMYKRGYSIDTNNVVTLGNEIEEVRREVKFVPVANEEEEVEIKGNEFKTKEVVNMERKQKVDALIANGHFTEDDREFLTKCECPQFTRLETLANKPPVKVNAETPAKPQTYEELIANAPADVRAQNEFVQRKLKQERDGLVTRIKGNTHNKLTDDQLAGMDITMLETIANSIAPAVNYDGGAGAHHQITGNADAEEPLEMPVYNEEKKKDEK
jgi:hypothetical protein